MSPPTVPNPEGFILGLYRLALTAYPRALREEWSGEMMETFRLRAADATRLLSRPRLLWFWIRELRAVVAGGMKLRWQRRGLREGGRELTSGPANRQRIPRMFEGIMTDLTLALRGMKKAPGFTLAAILVLSLGIGANATAFSAVKVAVLGTPPFPDADRMVMVDLLRKDGLDDPGRSGRWPYPLVLAVEDVEDRLVDPIAAFDDGTATLTGMGPAAEIGMELVSTGYFEVVGQPLPLGRGFTPQEGDEEGPFRVVVVSYGFWMSRLGGDSSALGRTLELAGEPFQVVGVAPRGFSGLGGDADLWFPMGATGLFRPGRRAQPFNHQTWVAGRLRPGATLESARTQLAGIMESLSGTWQPERYGLGARPMTEVWVNPGARRSANLMALGALMVLLVACANLSGLLITRARRRIRDGAVRLALGASRWRLVRLYLVESLTLATLGGMGGLALALVGAGALARAWPRGFLNGDGLALRVVQPGEMTLDGTVLGFTFLVVLATALLVGAGPVFRASRRDLTQGLKVGAGATRRGGFLLGVDSRAILLGGQLSLALILLIGAGLLGRSVRHLLGVDEGFQTEGILTFDFSRPQSLLPVDIMDQETLGERVTLAAAFDDRMLERLTDLPEVESATVGCGVLQGYCGVLGLWATDGQPLETQPGIGVITAQEDFFRVLEVPILRGRSFTSRDGEDSPPVVILSEAAAEAFFPGQDPLGHTIATGLSAPGSQHPEIVGVVGDVLFGRPDARGYPVAYFPTRQQRLANHAMVRTTVPPERAVEAIRDAIFDLDPTVAMSSVASADDLVSRSVGDRRLILGLLGLFSGVTLLLAAVGTWAVVAYSVADRRRELSLRMALGAGGRDVLGLVTRQMVFTAFVGLMVGVAGALAGSRLLESFLWETSPRDPTTFVGGSLFLLGVVLLAGFLPARRATRMDPAEALREE